MIKNYRFITILLMAMFLCPALMASGQQTTKKDLQNNIEGYLNGLLTLTADFVQLNPDHTVVPGRLWLKRSLSLKEWGKLRLDYDCQKIVTRGDELVLYAPNTENQKAGQMTEESSYPLDSTPAAFILSKKISFTKDLHVKEITGTPNNAYAKIILERPNDTSGMSLTLVFSLYPLTGKVKKIEHWVVLDAQGNETVVIFIPDTVKGGDANRIADTIFKPPFPGQKPFDAQELIPSELSPWLNDRLRQDMPNKIK
ncbi:MAG: outer membrane lipoprotein carrier protein LolA [Alphaproteobacteria bacterium]|nr:outer membrane lipoprotein carrier protein LolA [Alphaproteobacteria bacterium]